MNRPIPCLLVAVTLPAAAVPPRPAPLQVAVPLPVDLDLRQARAGDLLPGDVRDATQVEAAARAWSARVAALKAAPAVRLRLPAGRDRVPLLLAAAQALRAQTPAQRLLVAFDPGAEAVLDETAWGAVDGGALLPGDLGSDPGPWRARLAQAQEAFPGRPWVMWLPSDPGPLAGALLGDGARLVVPAGNTAAGLAGQIPEGFTEVEGAPGDLTLRHARGQARRWVFTPAGWVAAPLPRERTEVAVTDVAAYDTGALLGRIRAAQLRSRAAVQTLQARADLDLHAQGSGGRSGDLGFTFRCFEAAGEWPELLQQEVRFNGVKAKLDGEVQLPLVESRRSVSLPVALGLTEAYRYRDGGPAGEGRRRLTFAPVAADPTAYAGELLVEEASGRILEERRERSGLAGVVKGEREVLTYGEVAPGVWRPVSVQTWERWTAADGVLQVQRRFTYRDFIVNGPGFEADRQVARASRDTMLKVTPEGSRYFTRQADGSRRLEEKPRSWGRAVGGVVLVDPGLAPPVVPLGGLLYFDYDALGRGIQVDALTALLFNTASLAVPHAFGAFDLGANATVLLLKQTERPVAQGRLLNRDGVGHRVATLGLELGRDLGLGFRLEGRVDLQGDSYSEGETAYRTPGYALPPSGLTRTGTVQGSWLYRGLQVRAYHGWGQRPDGTYGTAALPQSVPEGGAFRRWGGSLGLDREAAPGLWLRGEVGWAGGHAFDRFNALDVGGMGGVVRVAGIRANALAADQVAYGKAKVVIPTGPRLRLTLGLDHARARSLDDGSTHGLTGASLSGDLPGFGWFTAVRVDLGVGLQSDIAGVKGVNGYVALLRVF